MVWEEAHGLTDGHQGFYCYVTSGKYFSDCTGHPCNVGAVTLPQQGLWINGYQIF